MSLYASLFGAKAKRQCPDHFQVRPFAQHAFSEALPHMETTNGQATPDCMRQSNGDAAQYHHVHRNRAPFAADNDTDSNAVAVNGASGRDLQAMHIASVAQHHTNGGGEVQEWRDRYDGSVTNIQDHIQAVAGAVAMLDGVEHKLIAIRTELERIRSADLRIDGDKVLVALQALSDYVNQAIGSVDDQCVNMLRDAKLEIKFAELAPRQDQADGIALTMISIDALLNYKIRRAFAEGLVAEETPEFVDDISRIVSSNIQILTAVLLSLFASRDYTQAVVKFAERESIVPHVGHQARGEIASPTIDRLQFDQVDQGASALDNDLQIGRESLSELLKKVQDERGELGAPGI